MRRSTTSCCRRASLRPLSCPHMVRSTHLQNCRSSSSGRGVSPEKGGDAYGGSPDHAAVADHPEGQPVAAGVGIVVAVPTRLRREPGVVAPGSQEVKPLRLALIEKKHS